MEVTRRSFLKALIAGVIVASTTKGLVAEDQAAVDALLDGKVDRVDGFKFYVIGRGGRPGPSDSLQIVPPGHIYTPYNQILRFNWPEPIDFERMDAENIDHDVMLSPWRQYAEQLRPFVPEQYRHNFERALRGARI